MSRDTPTLLGLFDVGEVGMVASSATVRAGGTLNQHYIASTENRPATERRFQLVESPLIQLSNFLMTIQLIFD